MKRVLALLTAVFLLVGAYVIFFSGIFSLRSIRFNEDWIAPEIVMEKLGVERGDNLLLLSPRDIRKNLMGDPRFEAVSMRKLYPDELVLQIVYRRPVAKILWQDSYVFVDADAMVLYIGDDLIETVTIEGMSLSGTEVGRSIAAGEGSKFRLALDLADLSAQSGIEVQSIRFEGNQLTLRIAEDFFAVFGDGKDLERRFTVFAAIYQDVTQDGTERGKIDVSNPDRPTYAPFAQ